MNIMCLSKKSLLLTVAFSMSLLMSCTSRQQPLPILGNCDQKRETTQAPDAIRYLVNPLKFSSENISAGKELYHYETKSVTCAKCHGKYGDGFGPMANMFDPQPRNFTCIETMSQVEDGQLFWIIKNGSPGTSMPAFDKLEDKQIWQLVSYLRDLAR